MTWLKFTGKNHRVAIAGTVQDSQTQQSLGNVVVQITQMPDALRQRLQLKQLQYGDAWDKMTERCDLQITKPDGHFHFLDLPVGDYQLHLSYPSQHSRYGTLNQSLTVNDGQPTFISLALSPTTLTGQLQTQEGEPVAFAQVKVSDSHTTCSDITGRYRLTALEAGPENRPSSQVVTVLASGYLPHLETVELIRGEVFQLNITLSSSLS